MEVHPSVVIQKRHNERVFIRSNSLNNFVNKDLSILIFPVNVNKIIYDLYKIHNDAEKVRSILKEKYSHLAIGKATNFRLDSNESVVAEISIYKNRLGKAQFNKIRCQWITTLVDPSAYYGRDVIDLVHLVNILVSDTEYYSKKHIH